MPTNTTNYLLVKPTKATDNADVNVINTNMDTVDTQMKTNADAASAAQAKADAAIPATEKSAANGVATLDAGGTIPDAQIPAAITRDSELTAHKTAAILDHPDGSVTDVKLSDTAGQIKARVATHVANVANPHAVTKAQVGLGNVDNLQQATKVEFNAHEADYTLQIPYAVATGVANTYAISTTIAALVAGMAVTVKINVASTGASTLNWNGKGAKGIKKADGTDMTNLKLNGVYTFRYDGVNFILQGEGGEYGTANAPQVLTGYTVGKDTGLVAGTMPIRTLSPSTGNSESPSNIYMIPGLGYWDGVEKVYMNKSVLPLLDPVST